MTPAEVERWAIQVIDVIARGTRVEDDRVELKRQLPADLFQAARRIAGHANQARSDRTLWLIGADDDPDRPPFPGMPMATPDPAAWWSQVPSPSYVHIPHDGVQLLAIGFETSRPPYVVKWAQDSPSREVPWRVATSVRSAQRHDLLQLLVPIADRPAISVLGGALKVLKTAEGSPHGPGKWEWIGHVELYIETLAPLILPDHRVRTQLVMAGQEVELGAVAEPQYGSGPFSNVTAPRGSIVERGDAQLVVGGSSPVHVTLRQVTEFFGSPVVPGASGNIRIALGIAASGRDDILITAAVRPRYALDEAEGIGEPTAAWSIEP